jgi:hypothetical protein
MIDATPVTPYPSQLASMTGLTAVNLGVDGARLTNMDTNYATHTAPSFNAATCNILILEGGINDIYNAGTQSSIDASVRSYCGKARATGFKVYLQTVAASNGYGWNSSLETIRQAVNTDRRTNYASYCDGLIDVDADAAFSNPANTTYFQSDQLHWTTAADTVVANLVKARFGL